MEKLTWVVCLRDILGQCGFEGVIEVAAKAGKRTNTVAGSGCGSLLGGGAIVFPPQQASCLTICLATLKELETWRPPCIFMHNQFHPDLNRRPAYSQS